MASLEQTATAFVDMAHKIVWANVATVDQQNRPRSRVLHPFWEWDGEKLIGWVGTGATQTKRSHLEHSPFVYINYWAPDQDTCVAECRADWVFDDDTCRYVWNRYLELPSPLGYNPAMIPGWEKPEDESFSVLRFEPWRLRVFPGAMLSGQGGPVLVWQN
ncbi:MAG: pyridoxamine 5'-phosphate oxidase family protein [Proteobacteria bacterium]|nr:pyridoxamine 5'-phosphate oxidase family protein [Pseudomonadota bacterium]